MFGKSSRQDETPTPRSSRSTSELTEILRHTSSSDAAASALNSMTPEERRRAVSGLTAVSDAEKHLRRLRPWPQAAGPRPRPHHSRGPGTKTTTTRKAQHVQVQGP